MYNLDFETIKQVMQEHQKTGYLRADVPAGAAGLQEHFYIEIYLSAGVITSCFIVTNGGQRLTEQESLKRIARLGRLKWIFTPLGESSALQAPSSDREKDGSIVPQRTVRLEQWQMQSWPRLHRKVFALADGTRSPTKIAEVLSAAPELVERALNDLQLMNVITMGPRNGSHHW